jgi:hypothetical protein
VEGRFGREGAAIDTSVCNSVPELCVCGGQWFGHVVKADTANELTD